MINNCLKDFPLYQLSSFLFFLLPLITLVYLYARMGLSIQQPSRQGRLRASVHGRDTLANSRGTILRMLGEFTVWQCVAASSAQLRKVVWGHLEEVEGVA